MGDLKMKILKMLLTAMMVGVLAIAAGCGNSEKVIVATDAAFAPFESLNEKGEIVGFDVELLEAVMAEAGLEYELTNTGWDPLFAAIQAKNVGMAISGISITAERKESYDFSNPYFESKLMAVFPEGMEVKGMADLAGVKIGVQNGTTGQVAVETILGKDHPSISKYDSTALAFMALKSGNVHVVVTDNTVAEEYIKNNPNDKLQTYTDPMLFAPEYYAMLFPKGSELKAEIDAALKAVIESGKYAEIYEKWFGYNPDVDVLLQQAE
jgi:glutamine transport system substrate-binding protein